MDPPQLTSHIKACTTERELLSLVEEHESAFNHIHASASLNVFAKMTTRRGAGGASAYGVTVMLQLAHAHVLQMRSRELTNTVGAGHAGP